VEINNLDEANTDYENIVHEENSDQPHEIFVVFLSDTIVEPLAVVVEVGHTSVTLPTVLAVLI
jgi:hypothetical protein